MKKVTETLLHQELTGQIIGAAMTVLNELKPGLDEKLYENALVILLRAQGHAVDQQQRFPVYFRDNLIGTLVPDLVVDGLVIADPKVVSAFNENHMAKMIGYLAISKLDVALLLNFKFARLQWKRIAHTRYNEPVASPDLEPL
jgi:GxxExxY protein